MTKKENEEKDSHIKNIFDFGNYTFDLSSTVDTTDTATFTWDVGSVNADYVFTGADWSSIATNTVVSTIDFEDPYAELEEFREEQEKDEALRKENPSLQEIYDNYQLVKKLVEDTEFDKTFEKRYEGFSKK